MPNNNLTIERFNEEIKAELAKVRNNDDVLSYLRECRDKYMDRLQDLQYTSKERKRDEMISDVGKRWNLIIDCLQSYMEGKLSKALCTMNEILKEESNIPMRVIPVNTPMDVKQKKILNIPWYRMRISESKSQRLTSKEMFHIPFEKRTLVKSCRYSVLGYPCIYASNTILATWCEMGEPTSNFAVSALQPEGRISLLDLTIPYPECGRGDYEIVTGWPLIIACSIKVKELEHPFKPEYVIPQLVMTTIKEMPDLHIDGCIYTSTKRDSNFKVQDMDWHNIAITAKTSPAQGYCSELTNILSITEPVYSTDYSMEIAKFDERKKEKNATNAEKIKELFDKMDLNLRKSSFEKITNEEKRNGL